MKGLNMAVCIKSVLKKAPDREGERPAELCELNPYDRPAIELALRIREEYGGCVLAVSMGPEDTAGDALLEAMAMGCSDAALVCDSCLAGSDTLATSRALAMALKKLGPFDLVIFGTRAADADTGQVGPQTATSLGLPFITWVSALETGDGAVTVERRADGFLDRYEVKLPAALTVHHAAYEPRDAPFSGIEDAYAGREYRVLRALDIGISEQETGFSGSPTRVLGTRPVIRERKCEFIEGPVQEQAKELMQKLMEKGLL